MRKWVRGVTGIAMDNWGLILLGILYPVSTHPPQRHKGTEMFIYEPWSLFGGGGGGAFSGGVKGRALWLSGSRAGQTPLVPGKALQSPSREREPLTGETVCRGCGW